MGQFAAALGADLQTVSNLLRQRAVGERTAGGSTGGQCARRSSALRCGSDSLQNLCPPRLPGTTVSASAADATRGSLPVASSSPPPICTAALTRATVSALDGTLVPTGSGSLLRPSSVGRAASAADLGLRRASMPRLMKAADNIGRAIRRINMGPVFPRPGERKP